MEISAKCQNCGGTEWVQNPDGDYVCKTCGYILSEQQPEDVRPAGQEDRCWECIDYLDGRKAEILEAGTNDHGDAEEYENLDAYCSAISSVLQTLSYYKERDAVLAEMIGREKLQEADQKWYSLKTAIISEKLGIEGTNDNVH